MLGRAGLFSLTKKQVCTFFTAPGRINLVSLFVVVFCPEGGPVFVRGCCQ